MKLLKDSALNKLTEKLVIKRDVAFHRGLDNIDIMGTQQREGTDKISIYVPLWAVLIEMKRVIIDCQNAECQTKERE